ncbi:hypothetical protein CISG_04224 [Coccidioides immitis RMSCC 3703]|uniref:Uncharacterized protein n=2 Tax=Coccidioides immitis TaxID=5501 RepID=A0A0J8TLF8_COCIT|nr:hypothetical protein CIRG_02284 [Coccidioides immitis RMSCC 2394]KMU74517.1 hypothetical protein CISG_04224 [Coccidioides immitis RMSCC 3703]
MEYAKAATPINRAYWKVELAANVEGNINHTGDKSKLTTERTFSISFRPPQRPPRETDRSQKAHPLGQDHHHSLDPSSPRCIRPHFGSHRGYPENARAISSRVEAGV